MWKHIFVRRQYINPLAVKSPGTKLFSLIFSRNCRNSHLKVNKNVLIFIKIDKSNISNTFQNLLQVFQVKKIQKIQEKLGSG